MGDEVFHWHRITLQPSDSIGFNRASFLLFFDLPFSLLTFLQGPLTQDVKRSLNITNSNFDPISFKISTTAFKVRPSRLSGEARLICVHSCTSYDPTLEKSTLARRLKSKVQYNISSSIPRGGLTRRAQSDAPSNERRTATECEM